MTAPLSGAINAVLARRGGRRRDVAGPERVAPGSIGHWHDATGADAEEALG
jgi:hypothetical protein